MNLLNLRATHVIRGKNAASYNDMQDILKIPVNPQLDAEPLPNLKTMEIYALVALPVGSAFLEHLKKTSKRFEGLESMWRSHEIADPALQKFKAILHIKFHTHRWLLYWKD